MVWAIVGPNTTIPLHAEAQNQNLKDYYASHPELKAKYGNVHRYINRTLLKFYEERGIRYDRESDPISSLEDHEWPTEFKTNLSIEKLEKLKSLLDMRGGGTMLVVDEALKNIIENLEPEVHRFRAVRLTTWDNQDFPRKFFTLLIGQFVDSFSPQNSDSTIYNGEFDTINNRQRYSSIGGTGLAFSREAFGAAHLWREKCLWMPGVFLSNELRDAIKDSGLKITSVYQMKEVA